MAASVRPMIRIVRLITRLNIGGPTHHVRILTTGLDRKRFQTLLLAGSPSAEEGNLTCAVRSEAHVRVIPELGRSLRPWRDVIAWCRIVVVLFRVQPDIVHTHMAKAGALGRSAAWVLNLSRRLTGRARCRVVHTFHGHVLEGYFSPLAARGFLACERWLARGSDRLIAINQPLEQALLKLRIGRPERMVLVRLGLVLEPFLSFNGGGQAMAPKTRPWRFGIIGRLVPIKNHQVLLEALSRFQARAPGIAWSLAIVGDGELRQPLEAQVQRLQLGERVRFLGWQNNLRALYQELDIVCLTSDNEGSPVALIEALAAAKPVLGTDVGGVGELLGGHCAPHQPFAAVARGMIVRPRDPEAIAAALQWAITHPEALERMAAEGQRYVRTTFSAARLINEMEDLYEQLVAG